MNECHTDRNASTEYCFLLERHCAGEMTAVCGRIPANLKNTDKNKISLEIVVTCKYKNAM